MQFVTDPDALSDLYGTPPDAALKKVARHMTPLYRKWITASRFCILSTVGPDGTDGSPRGDDGPVVMELDPQTLAMPDWRGNNRIDSLRNIVTDGRVSLLFMVPHSTTVVRVNGTAKLTLDDDLLAKFERNGKHPRSVIVIHINEIYIQCARAIMRSGLWATKDPNHDLPSAGDILHEMTQGAIDGKAYDQEWSARAATTLW